MSSKNSQPTGKRSALSRAPSRRKQGHAVTIEDAIDPEDHLHRVSEPTPAGMGASSGEVSAEWYTYTGNDLHVPTEPTTSEEMPTTLATDDEREATKPRAAEGSIIEQEPMPTSPLQKESHQFAKGTASGTPTAAATRATSPRFPIAEYQTDGVSMHPGISKSPNPMSPARTHFASQGPGLHPGVPWQFQPMNAHPSSERFAPHFFPPVPTASPAGFGLPFPPPPLPSNEIARVDPPGLSGYDLLASRLAGSLESEPPVPPLYRRFKAMNHRILLGLQDELCYMEDSLQNFDNADTFNRRCRDGVLPASRRHDNMEPNEATAARQALLDRIAHKLIQYNAHMNGFKKALTFKDAMPEDVHDYRAFLAATTPVVPGEMRFLTKSTDLLLCLPENFYDPNDESVSGDMTPPVTRNPRLLEAPTAPTAQNAMIVTDQVRDYTAARLNTSLNNKRVRPLSPAALRHIAVGMGMAIILPILSFPVIAGFVSRMTVVMLVALGMVVVGVQSGIYDAMAARSSAVEGAIAVGVYGAFMAIVAGTFG